MEVFWYTAVKVSAKRFRMFFIATGFFVPLILGIAGCDGGRADYVGGGEASPQSAGLPNQSVVKMVEEITVSRFFRQYPEKTAISGEELRALASDVASEYGLGLGEKDFFQAKGLIQNKIEGVSTQGKDGGETESEFSVQLVASSSEAHRGGTVKFAANATGGSGDVRYHFAKVEGDDFAVDEVPVFEGEPVESNEFTATFDKVGFGKVVVRAYDQSGNSARAVGVVEVKNRIPSVAIEAVPTAVHRGEVVFPKIETSDPDGDELSLIVELPDAAKIEDEKMLAFSVKDLGQHVFKIGADDGRGGLAETVFSITVTNRPPVASLSEPPAQAYPSRAVPLKLVFEDPDGDAVTGTVSHGDQIIKPSIGGGYDVAFHEPGEHPVKVDVRDSHGALTTTNIMVSVVNRLPEIKIPEVEIRATRNVPVELTSEIADPDGDAIEIKLMADGRDIPHQGGSSPKAVFDRLGPQTVEIVAIDSRGGESKKEVVINVANASPSVRLGVPQGDAHLGEEIEVSAVGTDPDGESLLYKFEIDGEGREPSTNPVIKVMPRKFGKMIVKVTGSDPEGGVGQDELTVNVVPRAPEIKVHTGQTASDRLSDVEISATGKCPESGEEISDFRVVVPSNAEAAGGGKFIVRFDKIGTNAIVVEGKSSLGAVGRGDTSVAITNIPPKIAINAVEQTFRGETIDVALAYKDEDGDATKGELKGGWEAAGGEISDADRDGARVLFRDLGDKILKVSVVDEDGGVAFAEKPVSVVNRNPEIQLSVKGDEHYRNTPVGLSCEAKDGDKDDGAPELEFYVNGNRVEGPAEQGLMIRELGKHEIKVVAKDKSGGFGEAVAGIEIKNHEPTVNLSLPDTTVKEGKEVRVEAKASDPDGENLSYSFEVNGVRFPQTDRPFTDVVFSKKGKHTIAVTVTDSDGGSGRDSAQLVAQ
jgi:hypothetical protein